MNEVHRGASLLKVQGEHLQLKKATCCKSAASGQTFPEEPRNFANKDKLSIKNGEKETPTQDRMTNVQTGT